MDVVDRSKALFKERLAQVDPELVAEVETWDDYSQNFFWAYMYKRMQQIFDARLIEEIMHGSSQGDKPSGLLAPELSATPFRDAEGLIHPGKWFSRADKWIR